MKIREFAEIQGVTPQAVYKLLKTHEDALKGHVLKAKKGTELDAHAVAYLQEKMIGNNVVVADRQQYEEIERLKAELQKVQDELILKNQLLINAQDKVLQIEEKREEQVKEAAAKLKEHYLEEIKQLQTELQTERNRKWKFPWSR